MIEPTPPDGHPTPAPRGPFLRRVKARNYKSLTDCDVELGMFTVLVGRNGSGKSNFLDALSFVVDSLRTSLNHAFQSRHGAVGLWRQGAGEPCRFMIELELDLRDGRQAVYRIELTLSRGRDILVEIAGERLSIWGGRNGKSGSFHAGNGELFHSSESPMSPVPLNRLYLPLAAGLPAFRDVYDALLAVGVYDLDPRAMKGAQEPSPSEFLRRDGSNIAGVIGRLGGERPGALERVKGYLSTIVPGVSDVNRVILGPLETLVFDQSASKFHASSMSDGTLRALGVLVAVAQQGGGSAPLLLVGIEEPETSLHPAASCALMEALKEAAVHTQIVVTTQSADLLDLVDPETDRLLVVQNNGGETEIGLIDPASRQILKEHLYSPGELLRMDQLEPDRSNLERRLRAKSESVREFG